MRVSVYVCVCLCLCVCVRACVWKCVSEVSTAVQNPTGLMKKGGMLETEGDLVGALKVYQLAAKQFSALGLFCVG